MQRFDKFKLFYGGMCCSGWRAQVLAPSRRDPPCWTRSSPSFSPPACSSPFSSASSSITPFQVRSYIKYGGWGGQRFNHLNEGGILGRNLGKSLESFPPCYSQSPLQRCLEIFISLNSRNLLQFLVQLLYTAKEKEENLIENHTRFPMGGLRNLYRNLKSQNSEDYA
jgi:hypothetical protein